MKSLQEVDHLAALEIAQKSKVKWSVEGDENTRYFQGILNKKRVQSAIRGVLSDEVWIDDPVAVKNIFLVHFKDRFNTPLHSRCQLDMDFLNTLSTEQLEDLERNISNEEIKQAVWDCGLDKSPGPDGFTFGFYRRFWNIVHMDVVEAVKCFFQNGTFPRGGNSSFIALIPKMHDGKMVKDFRPITLISSMYKIIAKILANRLRTVLGDLVNEV
ncbi:hypothetical protein Tco_0708339 [Tanacetum coccineum]